MSWSQIINIPEIFKDFFACRIALAANHQYSGMFQRLPASKQNSSSNQQSSSNPQQQPAAATNNINQQQQPAKAINSSNQQQQPATSSCNQQQQPTTAINSSNQQKQSTAAINSSNQQQAAATGSSNQQQQPASSIPAATSNQQQQLTEATSSSNQRQQPAAASNSNNQLSSYQQHLHDQRQPLLVITTFPSRGYPASSWSRTSCPVEECNHRTEAHFCYFFLFFEIPFLLIFPFFYQDWELIDKSKIHIIIATSSQSLMTDVLVADKKE